MEVILAWPPKELSPNARVHWSKKAKAAKAYRYSAYIACRLVDIVPPTFTGKILLTIDFYPHSNGRNDLDNLLARIKSGIDGVSDYLGIDDCMFDYTISKKDKISGGRVVVQISKR